MEIGYFGEYAYNKHLEINDIGNVAICGIDTYDDLYYIFIKTDCGLSSIFEYGPYLQSEDEIPPNICATYNRIKYNRAKLSIRISKFLGTKPKKKKGDRNYIIDAWIMDESEIQDLENLCPSISSIFMSWNYSKGSD